MKHSLFNRMLLTGILTAVVLFACKKKEFDSEVNLPRQFTPSAVSVTTSELQAKLTWPVSLFTTDTSGTYTVQVSEDSTFATGVIYNEVVSSREATVTDNVLQIRKYYFARVKANALGEIAESGWVTSSRFRIMGEQRFFNLAVSDINDISVLLRWRPTPGLTRIELIRQGGTPTIITLTPADLAAERKILTGLTANTNYSVELFDATKSKGFLEFRTTAPLSGIDLRGITGRPSVLADTLPVIPDGSTVILKRGETYTIAAALNLSKSVKIISGPDLADPTQAIILMPNNFNITAGSNIGFIDFQDVALIGTDYAAKYVFNISAACTIGRMSFESCRMSIFRGVTRLQTAIINVKKYTVNNCIIDSISNYGVIAIDNVLCTADTVSITNSTIYKTERIITSRQNSSRVVIDYCTVNEATWGNSTSSFIVDYNTSTVTNGIVITNSIFGRGKLNGTSIMVRDVRASASTSITSTNNYITSDHTVAANPLTPVTTYAGTAADLWVSPYTANFRFKDATFAGRQTTGDPRWR